MAKQPKGNEVKKKASKPNPEIGNKCSKSGCGGHIIKRCVFLECDTCGKFLRIIDL